MKFLSLLSILPLIQAIPIEPLVTKSSASVVASTPRLAVYVQTYHDEYNKETNLSLLPLLGEDILPTHVILAAMHVTGTPGIIHLNDDPPDAPMYDELWDQVKVLQAAGIKVSCMIGGAAGGTWNYLAGEEDQVI